MAQATLKIETTLHDEEQPTTITVAQDQNRYPSTPDQVLKLSDRLGKLICEFHGDAVEALLAILPE